MARIKTHTAGSDGWSEWIVPVMDGYRIACCECGLVHNMQFKAHKIVLHNADGSWEAKELDPEKYRVEFRVSLNNRSTGQVRRHKKGSLTMRTGRIGRTGRTERRTQR